MEKNEKTSLSDHLISPTRIAHKQIANKVKVIPLKDGLVERANPKVVTLDGKELLSENTKKSIL